MGPDNVNSYLLKLDLPSVVESLTYVYNLCIQQNTFPPALKAAKVIPLPKAKDLSDPNDFRPISLLSILTKPLERHIDRHLTQFIEDRNLFHPFQSGFRQRHSCHTVLISLWHLARCNQPSPAYLRSLPRSQKSFWSRRSYDFALKISDLFAESVSSIPLKVISTLQNTKCFFLMATILQKE